MGKLTSAQRYGRKYWIIQIAVFAIFFGWPAFIWAAYALGWIGPGT